MLRIDLTVSSSLVPLALFQYLSVQCDRYSEGLCSLVTCKNMFLKGFESSRKFIFLPYFL